MNVKIYLVGGAIRDELLQLPIKDKDWVVVGATPKIMLDLGYQLVGNNFPVFINPISGEEYALARTEKKTGKGYKGFLTYFHPKVTIEEDLMRRDLTINAIARNKLGEYIDPCKGYKDIKLKILKHISISFIEDPLRILRVARFAAYLSHLGFTIAKKTITLMKIMVRQKTLNELTKERIWKETEKAISTFNPHIYIKILHECKAFNCLFYEIKIFKKILINKIVNKLITNLEVISYMTNTISIRCAILFYTLIKEIKYSEKNSIILILNFCKKFKIPNNIRDLSILSIKCENFVRNNLNDKKEKLLIKILDYIDAWRKPYRIEQISIINLTYYHNKNLDKYYLFFSKNILLNAFQIAIKINIQSIIQEGYHGLGIKKEVQKRRIQAIQTLYKTDYMKNIK